MKLGEKQEKFMRLLPRLIDKVHELGFEARGGDLYRAGTCSHGHKNSLHRLKLAIDINLTKDGVYLSDTESHRKLGEFWESLDDDCTWGGRWGDGNHYSLTHNGMK